MSDDVHHWNVITILPEEIVFPSGAITETLRREVYTKGQAENVLRNLGQGGKVRRAGGHWYVRLPSGYQIHCAVDLAKWRALQQQEAPHA